MEPIVRLRLPVQSADATSLNRSIRRHFFWENRLASIESWTGQLLF